MYTCERCGYCPLYKGNLKNHLNRKIICKPLLKDIGIAVLKAKINKKEKLIKNVSIGSPNVSMDVSIGTPNVSMDVSIGSPNVSIGTQNVSMDVSIENYKCRSCFKIFKHRQSRHRHELVYCSDTLLIKEPKALSPLTITDNTQSNDIKLLKYIEIIKKEKKDIQTENELIKKEKKDMLKENKLIKKEKKAMGKENELIKKEKKAMGKEIEKLIDKVGNVTTNNNMLQQSAKERYETLKQHREHFLDRGQECSELTIPSLINLT